MKRNLCYALAAFLYSQTTFAMFCPSSFVTINIGDTVDQVRQACKPDTESTKKIDPPDTLPHTWTYYVTQPGSLSASSMRLDVVFNAQHKVINISSNGAGIANTNLCGNQSQPIQTGYTMEQIKAVCGSPMFIDNGNPGSVSSDPNAKKIEITEFKYNSTPPTTLTFEDGKLKSRSTP